MKSLLIHTFFWILGRKSHLLHLDSLDQQIWQVLVDCQTCNPVVTWRNMDMFRTVDSFKTEKKKRNTLDICGPGNSAGDLIGKVKWLFKSVSDLLLQLGDQKVTTWITWDVSFLRFCRTWKEHTIPQTPSLSRNSSLKTGLGALLQRFGMVGSQNDCCDYWLVGGFNPF